MRLASAAAAALLCAACRSAPSAVPARAEPPDGGARAEAPQAGADAGVAAPDDAARAEAAWERRGGDPGALDQAIALWEDAALRAPDPGELLLKAARGRRLRVDEKLRSADADLALAGQDALACAAGAHRSWTGLYPTVAAQLDGTRGPAQIFAQVGPNAAEALYLEAICTAAWARTQGFTPLIDRRGELLEELKRVATLAPDLDGAGAQRELGRLLAALPAYAGGDLDEARKQLEAAVQRAPADARNHLALARTVAVKAQDRRLFERELAAVSKGDDAVASAEAAGLLVREDELFGPAEAAQPTPGGTQR